MSDFREAILQVIQEFKSIRDYEKLNPLQLLYHLARLRALGRDTLARVILFGWPDVDLKRVAEETADISDNLSWKYIDRLCELCQNPAPAMYLVWSRLEQDAIYEETSKRLKKSKPGAELLRLFGDRVRPKDRDELYKALKVERMTTYKPKKESSKELKEIAEEGALKAFRKIGETRKIEMTPQESYPLTPLARFLPVKPEVSERWEIVNAAMYKRDFAMMQEYYLPALEDKKIHEGARQALRDRWEKRDAQKREGEGEEVDLSEGQRILRREGRLYSPLEEMEQNADVSARMFRVLKEAKRHKRWGDKAVKAIRYYLEGKTEEEASKLAKIDPRTFRNYIARLQKRFASKK